MHTAGLSEMEPGITGKRCATPLDDRHQNAAVETRVFAFGSIRLPARALVSPFLSTKKGTGIAPPARS